MKNTRTYTEVSPTTGTLAAGRRVDRTIGDEASRSCSPVRVVAVIPALNEAPSIAGVVGKLRNQRAVFFYRVVVVDNGSTDGTGKLGRRAGATVVREGRRGYGYACRAGVHAAGDADVIVLLDGDAADETSDLPRVLAPLLEGRADLVFGSRVAEPGSMSLQQVLGNRLATFLMRRSYGTEVTDLGAVREIRRDDLLALRMGEMTYGWSAEMMAKAIRAGYRYREVPVEYHRRVGVSKVGGTLSSSLRAGLCIIFAILRYSRWLPGVRGGREIR